MIVLGISALYHDSAAVICEDGKIVAAVSEERFTRKKADASIPRNAIRFCLNMIPGKKVDTVVYYDNPLATLDRWIKSCIMKFPEASVFEKSFQKLLGKKIWIKELIFRELDSYIGDNTKFFVGNHHMSHAASAFYPSPFRHAAILTIDGVGEWTTTTIGKGDDSKIKLLEQLQYPDSVGLLYSAFTYFCGFKVNFGEYKLMGLAAYGNPIYEELIKKELVEIKDDGSIKLNMEYFCFLNKEVMTDEKMEKLFGISRRKPEDEMLRIYIDIAASIQKVTEEIILKLVKHTKKVTGEDNLVMAGGVALNCVANGLILKEKVFDKIWIQPAAGDAGGALGAALYASYQLGCERYIEEDDSQQGSFLGPQFSPDEICEFLKKNNYMYHQYKNQQELFQKIAEHISEDKVVGLFQGRMEFGPRALGCRSIIANPMSEKMQSKLNQKIKFRESFRPFAPAVLQERASDFFDLESESPYMLLTALLKECEDKDKIIYPEGKEMDLIAIVNQKRSKLPAVTHVDYTARVQTVNNDRNPYFYQVIQAFDKLTGCPVVINTSFNVRGEPIVCTPEDAYLCFMRTGMDILVLEDCILVKEEQPELNEQSDWRNDYELD